MAETKTIAASDDVDAWSLVDFINEKLSPTQKTTAVVYIEDDAGRRFENVKLVEEILTDGSKVYNLVLS